MQLILDDEEVQAYFELKEDMSALLQKYHEVVYTNNQLIQKLQELTNSDEVIDTEYSVSIKDHN